MESGSATYSFPLHCVDPLLEEFVTNVLQGLSELAVLLSFTNAAVILAVLLSFTNAAVILAAAATKVAALNAHSQILQFQDAVDSVLF